jgi:sec-independent protein translocase protein TatC
LSETAGCRKTLSPDQIPRISVAQPNEEDKIDDKPMPLLDHLIELRTRLLWSMGAFLVAFFVCYHFSGEIYSFLAEPLAHVLESRGENRRLIYTSLTEAFFTYLKVAFFGAAFLAFPVIAGQLYLFIAPGLYRSEKRAFLPFLLATPILFVLGAALAYYFVFPVAWSFFISFETSTGGGGLPIELEAKVGEYLDLVMKLIFAFGVAFQLPVALSLLAKVGIVSSKSLKKYRRYAYVGMFIIAAILAPPDVITQCGLAIPLIGLYEISILAARIVEPKPAPDLD